MTRKPNGPRVTPKKSGAKKPVHAEAPAVVLKERTGTQKTAEFQTITTQQQDDQPAPDDAGLTFLYNEAEFEFKPIDSDMTGMLASAALLGEGGIEDEKEMLKLILIDGDWARLRVAMRKDIAAVNGNRREWKENGSDPETEPIGVIEFMTEAIAGIIGIYTKAVTANPKGSG